MHHIGRLIHLVALTTVIALHSTQAQNQSEGEVQLQFVSFPKAANPEPIELYLGEGKTLEVEIPTNRLSKKYSVKAMPTWILGKTAESAVEDADPVFAPYGRANSISSPTQLILVIRKGRQNEDGLALIPMPNTARNFGGGSFFFLNATPMDIAGIISNKRFSLKPGKFTIVEPEPSEVKGVYRYCKTQLAYRKGDDVRAFFNSTWRLNDKARSLIFFYLDPKTQRIRMHSIRDYL